MSDAVVQHVLATVAIVIVAFVITKIGQHLVGRFIDDPARQYRARKMLSRTAGILTLLILVVVWSPNTQDAITLLTIVGAGLAISMREALLSFVGWLNVTFRTPYTQGDRIEVYGIKGDVIDIRLLHTTLMEVGGWVGADQSTGRIVHVPNAWIFQHGVYNYTRGFKFIWNEVSVTLTFRSDWAAAREIMLRFAEESAAIVEQQAGREIRQLSREYLIHYSILTPFVYVRVVESGVHLTLRYLCEARKRRGTEHALTLSFLQAFQEHGSIELAYPMVGTTAFALPQFGSAPNVPTPPEGATPFRP